MHVFVNGELNTARSILYENDSGLIYEVRNDKLTFISKSGHKTVSTPKVLEIYEKDKTVTFLADGKETQLRYVRTQKYDAS